jgi:hypothetical protein
MTFRSMKPYLKGFFLTLYGWHGSRDPEGWRLLHHGTEDMTLETPEEAPEYVTGVPRFMEDLERLLTLTRVDRPPLIPVRPTASAHVLLGFGDAAKSGFGVTAADQRDLENVHYKYGVWMPVIKMKSSNHKEMLNFVNYLVQGVNNGTIREGTEVFMFTDNFVTERAFFKGTSSTRELNDLVFILRELEMKGRLFIHLIWVAGTRMIDQGVDGLSRGDLENGVMTGRSMLDFIPIHSTAFERSRTLEPWLRSWMPTDTCFLSTEQWFDTAHKEAKAFVWTPAPPIADAALDQLFEARHTRPHVFHFVLIPNLMTYKWRKSLRKAADVLITIRVGPSIWGTNMHESLTFAILCPLIHRAPWHLRPTAMVGNLEADLSGMWTPSAERERDSLCQFYLSATTLETVPERVARGLLRNKDLERGVPDSQTRKRRRRSD